MASWRRRAIDTFPSLRADLNKSDYTIYSLFFDLLAQVREAHRAGDDAQLRAIYGFALGCARSQGQPLWNAAGVAFYEHLFDEPWMREAAVKWLPADVRRDCVGLWERRLSANDLADVHATLRRVPPAS